MANHQEPVAQSALPGGELPHQREESGFAQEQAAYALDWSPSDLTRVESAAGRGVFLSYRRQDTGPYARLLKNRLDERLPGTPVFMDLEFIEAGADLAETIESAVRSCAVLVALIGSQWLTASDGQGRPRLDDPDDYVRLEIQIALEPGVRVIPVIVDGAAMPSRKQLPVGLQKLARLSALEMSHGRFEYDADKLTTLIQKVLATVADS